MDDDKIRSLDPRIFYRNFDWPISEENLAAGARERFETFYAGVRDDGASAYDLDRIASAIFYLRSLLIRSGLTGIDKTAVEVGCGTGNKAFSLQGLFGSYIGIDLNETQIMEAKQRNKIYGAEGTRFILANAATALTNRRDHGMPTKIDLLILYAVIEHLTDDERRVVIELASQVMEDGGCVLVMESPNRLIPYDSHTTGLHFFNWLPDAMAARVARLQAQRREVADSMLPWSDPRAPTMLARVGRGVSYHDFETNLCKPIRGCSILRDSYEVEMLNIEPFVYQEFNLLGYMQKNVSNVPAMAFSRSWIDFIIGRERGRGLSRQFVSPHHPNWASFLAPPSFWEPVSVALNDANRRWSCEAENRFVSDLTVLCSAPTKEGRLMVRADGSELGEVDIAELDEARPSTWHRSYAVSFSINRSITEISVEVMAGHAIEFLGAIVSYRET